MKKICKSCKKQKLLSEFYKHKEMLGGYLNFCKKCVITRVKKYRLENIEAVREYDRNRPNHKDRIKKNKKNAYKYKNKRGIYSANYRKNNLIKYHAHCVTRNAVKRGEIKKYPCVVCGKKEVEAHHEDYSKPLDIIWFCRFHHLERHTKLKEISRR